ncbi:hypothetical protein Trydic_g16555 [Trypoxylus dichotomus]
MDLAENVDDLICAFDGIGDTTMDTLAMFLFGWILAAFFVLWLGKFVYSKFLAKQQKLTEVKAKIETPNTAEEKSTLASAAPATSAIVSDSVDGKASIKKSFSLSKGSTKGVPATPPVRRRLTRQSPGPDLKKTKYVPAPQCTGADNISVLWVNDVFQWLYNDLVIVNEILQVWIQTLNEYCKKSDVEQGVGIEFVRILPETHPPTLTNLFCECDTRDDVTLTCDCEATPAFQLKCVRKKADKIETSHYRVNVNRLRARLNIFCVTDKLQANLKCDGWPEIKIALAPVGNIKNNLDENQLQEVVSEVVTAALRSTEFNINLAQYPTCPRLIRHLDVMGRPLPVHYDSMLNAYASTPNHVAPNRIPGNKRLLVKVTRAANLGVNQGCQEPYCVVEMDEPPQKYQTSFQKNTNSPYWDEHFLFDVSQNTQELLFEVYDHAMKPSHKFLGLGIVGVEELLVNPSQRQTITLQSRPYESDQISGTLTVEFMFIEGADIPVVGNQPYKIKETLSVSPSRGKLSPSPTHNENITNGGHFVDDRNNTYRGSPYAEKKNTLVIQSVNRQPSQRVVKVELNDGSWKEVERVERPLDMETLEQELHEKCLAITQESNNVVPNGNTDIVKEKPGEMLLSDHMLQTQLPNDTIDYRGRPRKRKDFFGTIKRRLGRSKTRSKSAGPDEANDITRDDSLNRSISADRGRVDGYKLHVPGGRLEETSRRSSMSEASGLSSASTRTYVNEASTLVLETLENGVKKHYLVPLSLAQKSKWKKKGTKLHIFSDHTFIAKHLSGGTVCQVCSKSIARRIGKQGYECRDCLLKCHKHCHVKVNDNCPTSTIHNIELSYIRNPYTDKNIRML